MEMFENQSPLKTLREINAKIVEMDFTKNKVAEKLINFYAVSI